MDQQELDRAYPAFEAAAYRLVQDHRALAVRLAAEYYQTIRGQAAVRVPMPTIPVPALNPAPVLTSLRFNSVVSVKMAIGRGREPNQAMKVGLVRTMGAADKYINDGAREWIRVATIDDPAALGWRRVTLGTCDFCRQKATSYGTQSGSAPFPRHDHCGCQPEPQFDSSVTPPPAPAVGDDALETVIADTQRATFTEGELAALQGYIQGSATTNAMLRAGDELPPLYARRVDRIDSAIEKVSLSQPVNVYRGVEADKVVIGKVGTTISDPAYVSTSASSQIAASFRSVGADHVLFEYRLQPGQHALAMDAIDEDGPGSEQEVLLARGQRFMVVEDSVRAVPGLTGLTRVVVLALV